ncbi:MAG TPA: hypothetical protein HA322_00215 [Candidatus Poseidoniaceae archaeon]|nr:hypothetical protein [Candidatus Poseidoniaceae archaeon]
MWRKMLQQESEHQWLAISAFFVFIIIGAFFIKGTSHLPGIDLTENELGTDNRIMESHYIDKDNSFILTYIDGTYEFVSMNSGKMNKLIDSNSEYDASSISHVTTLDNDSVLISSLQSDVILIDGSNIFTFETNFGEDNFSVSNIEQSSSDSQQYLMITRESENQQSIRGFNSSGLTSSNTPNDENVNWQNLMHIGEQKWLATGTYNAPATSGDQSPAAPNLRPAWGIILWNGGYTAPMVDSLQIGEYGEYHSTIKLNHNQVIIAGTHETVLFNHQTNDIKNIDYSSVAAISDKCNSAWLFNNKDSKSVLRFDEDSWDVETLPHSIPIDIEASGFDGTTIYLHGIDDNGNPKVLTFDTSAVGSIESGSGFLNLAFIIVSLIMFTIMGVNVIDKFKQ